MELFHRLPEVLQWHVQQTDSELQNYTLNFYNILDISSCFFIPNSLVKASLYLRLLQSYLLSPFFVHNNPKHKSVFYKLYRIFCDCLPFVLPFSCYIFPHFSPITKNYYLYLFFNNSHSFFSFFSTS